MTTRKQPTGRATSTFKGLMIGLAVNLTVTLISATLLANMVDNEVLAWDQTGYGILCILIISSFAGAYTSCSRIKRQRFAICSMSAALYWSVLLAANALLYGGEYEAIAVTMAVILAGTFAAFLLSVPRSTQHNRRKRRIRTR